MSAPRALFALLAAAGIAAAAESPVLRTYPLLSPPREAQLTALRLLAGTDGQVLYDAPSGKLLVIAPSNVHAQVVALLAPTDASARNVRVDVTTRRTSSRRDTGAALNAAGGVRVTPHGTGYRVKAAPRVIDDNLAESSVTRQSLVVQDGGEASMAVSHEVPHFDWLWAMGQTWGYVPRDMIMREAGAFLTVRPRILADGKTVNLRLVPELRGKVNGRPTRIEYARVATEVNVLHGATVTLGGLGSDREFSKRFLIGFDRSGSAQSMEMTVSPRILGPDGRP